MIQEMFSIRRAGLTLDSKDLNRFNETAASIIKITFRFCS